MPVPTYDRLMNPLLKALVQLGGSASVEEMYEEVIEQEGYPEEVTSVLQNPENSSQSKIAYRLAWARTYLKKAGYLYPQKAARSGHLSAVQYGAVWRHLASAKNRDAKQ